MRPFIHALCRTIYADSGTERIDIHQLMSHNHDFFGNGHKFVKGTRLYSCFYACVLFYFRSLASKITYAVSISYNDLVAASAKRKLYTYTRRLKVLYIRSLIAADTDAYRNGNIVVRIYLFYVLDYGEFVLADFLYRACAHKNKIFILFEFTHDTIVAAEILIYFPVDKCRKNRTAYFFDAF